MKRIQDRNVRIQKIMNDLNIVEPLTVVELSTCEKPESLLSVEDHEVPFEKYISEEERARLEEQARLEEGKIDTTSVLRVTLSFLSIACKQMMFILS